MKLIVIAFVAVWSASIAAAEDIPKSVAPEAIPNYTVVNPGLAAAGQPSPEALARLKSFGFKTVVNLRTPGEDKVVEKEAAIVTAQGLRYVSVPISPGTFSAADVAAVRKILDDDASAPVLLHCASANRVGGLWAAIEVSRGRRLEDAEAEGKRIGLHSQPMIDALHRVAGGPAARSDAKSESPAPPAAGAAKP
jgi:uncharacterized protein (TIGR01244 family)